MRASDRPEPDAPRGPTPPPPGPAWEFTRAERVDLTTATLALAGEFDLAAYDPAGEVLRALEGRGAHLVVIDLEQVSFISLVASGSWSKLRSVPTLVAGRS